MADSISDDRPQIIDHFKGRSSNTRRRLLWGMVLIIGVPVLIALFLQSPNQEPRSAPRVQCQSNLSQIGRAIYLYCNDNHGQFPDSFPTILVNEDLIPAVFVCPSTTDLPAIGVTTQETADQLMKPGHCSYIYVGRGLNSQTITPDTIEAYEPLSNNKGLGMNVLFGDGHVEFLDAVTGSKIISIAATGKFPVTRPSP